MNRTPKAEVRRQLRREVGFGCPVDGCRKPFLSYHHFDPPWEIEQHENPEGLIALCPDHHAEADGNSFSKGELHALKRQTHDSNDVHGRFPSWRKPNLLIRMGGIYLMGPGCPIEYRGQRIVTVKRDEQGLLLLSFQVHDSSGEVVLEMEDNDLVAYPPSLHDLEVTCRKNRIKMWHAKRTLGLDLTFKRLSLVRLMKKLNAELRNGDKNYLRHLERTQSQDPIAKAEFMANIQKEIDDPNHRNEFVERICERVERDCLDDDGLVPFLDFNRLRTYCPEEFKVENGICGVTTFSFVPNYNGVAFSVG